MPRASLRIVRISDGRWTVVTARGDTVAAEPYLQQADRIDDVRFHLPKECSGARTHRSPPGRDPVHHPELLPDGDTLLFTMARRVIGGDPWDKASVVTAFGVTVLLAIHRDPIDLVLQFAQAMCSGYLIVLRAPRRDSRVVRMLRPLRRALARAQVEVVIECCSMVRTGPRSCSC